MSQVAMATGAKEADLRKYVGVTAMTKSILTAALETGDLPAALATSSMLWEIKSSSATSQFDR
jgi:hypothetical protein